MKGIHGRGGIARLGAASLLTGSLLGPVVPALPAHAAGALSTPPGVGANVRVSPNDGNVYETVSAAIDPNDPGTIVAGADSWMPLYDGAGYGALPLGVFRTSEGGATWATSTLPWNSWPALRPWLAMSLNGRTYAGWTVGPCCGPHPARDTPVVAISSNQGASWTTPVEPAPNAVWPSGGPLGVDDTTSPYRNRVYTAYGDAAGPGAFTQYQSVLLGRSDNGTTWSSFTVKTSTAVGPTNPAVGRDGAVYLGMDDPCAGPTPPGAGPCVANPGQLLVAKSADGGATFTTPAPAVNTSIGFASSLANYGTSNCGSSVGPDPSLAVDRSGGVNDSNLYLVWSDNPSPPRVHVYFARSVDRGATWSAPMQIDTGNTNDAWEPAIAVDDAYGTVALSWYDRRDDPNDKLYRIYYTESIDGGASFLPTQVPVSSAQADPTTNCTATGAYAAIVASHGVAHPFWTDSRSGSNEIFTAGVSELALIRALGRMPATASSPVPWKPRPPATGVVAARGTPAVTLPRPGGGNLRSTPTLTLPSEGRARSRWFAPF